MIRKYLLLSASAAVMTSALTLSAQAQETADGELRVEAVTVTATRRAESVQDIPINISAIGDQQITEQGFDELADMLAYVPGINVVDRGGRQGNPLIVRGLNADGLGSGDGNNNGGGTVATYIGEIPVYLDLKLNDLERVEVLLGPQGTLYGAGTLGGAIRYIPKKPDFAGDTLDVRTEIYQYSEADDLSYDAGLTINKALAPNFAIRASVDYENDSGFIDYPYVVREIGVSNPDPDFTDPADVAANLRRITDADSEETISARIAARWEPLPWLDTTLTYYLQKSDIGGRRGSSARSTVPAGDYELAKRVEEPNEITNQLLALEMVADLGFAELTSATGYSRFNDNGQRDQTDLLITLEYSYEAFPTFTSFTHEKGKESRINQELRLVSTTDGPLNWIVGAFYNQYEGASYSAEYTPGYADFAGFNRPDDLEYFSQGFSKLEESAFFGEIGYDITDKWTVTVGGRYYQYDLESFSDVDFPLFDPGFARVGVSALESSLRSDFAAGSPNGTERTSQSDEGTLFKINTSYQVTDDILGYFTISEGYRIGNQNGIAVCPDYDPTNTQQGACALLPGQQYGPGAGDISTRDESQYLPDKTINYELGFKSTLANGRLILNGAVYYIEWKDPQLTSATINASIPITVNAEGAETKGFEVSGNWLVTDAFSVRGSYSHTEASLTAVAPGLVGTISPPGFSTILLDGQDGDRLPGSPEDQFSVFGSYVHQLASGRTLTFNGSYSWQGDVLSRTGGRGGGLTLDSYGVANASAVYDAGKWQATLFVNNLFDEYYETGVVSSPLSNQIVADANGDPVYIRSFYTYVGAPRAIGIRASYKFGQ
ncbi:TonB-dependent receptor [Hyphomonas polymorpha PS728]|uniref:TonB-dependent receptor n=1 Tax=Hyphomonas polymorpha PS728 TaxID=1280954 RepID=A0A062V911_9PROT|nr:MULTISPECIES: TonB-dependent receptor [Hyphomonas]AXE65971.1 TonB-dependent receptor [Hyphomonas sp. CACIAM 19H1]KCZ98707.1 TonB-dependent receptor [Hyphomonas polymorpha PS728]